MINIMKDISSGILRNVLLRKMFIYHHNLFSLFKTFILKILVSCIIINFLLILSYLLFKILGYSKVGETREFC